MCVASAKVVCTERKEPLCILWLSAMRLQISSAFFAQRSNPRSRQTSRMCRWSYLMLFILPSFQTVHVTLPKVWPKRSSLHKAFDELACRSDLAMLESLWNDVEWCGMMWNDVEWCGMMWNDVEWCGMMWNVFRCCQILRRPFLGWYSWCWHFTASVQPQNLIGLVLSCCHLGISWLLKRPRFYLCEYLATSQAGGAQWTIVSHSEPSVIQSSVVVAIGEPSSLTSYMVLSTCVALWSPQIRKLQRQWSTRLDQIGTPITWHNLTHQIMALCESRHQLSSVIISLPCEAFNLSGHTLHREFSSLDLTRRRSSEIWEWRCFSQFLWGLPWLPCVCHVSVQALASWFHLFPLQPHVESKNLLFFRSASDAVDTAWRVGHEAFWIVAVAATKQWKRDGHTWMDMDGPWNMLQALIVLPFVLAVVDFSELLVTHLEGSSEWVCLKMGYTVIYSYTVIAPRGHTNRI